jgi:hypothetical protein
VKRIPLWPHGEQFFLIEVLAEGLQAVLATVDEDKHLTFGREWRNTTWQALSGRLAPHRFIKNVVVGADSSLAYTAIVPIRILRDNPNTTLYAVELENLFAKEVGRVFSLCRSEASKMLHVDDLDVVLANSRVIDIKLDGHRVLHPVGMKAEKLEAVLELSLTTRELFHDIKSFLKSRQNLYFTEIGRAELLTISKTEPLPLHVLRLRAPASLIMRLESEPIGYSLERKEFNFEEDMILSAISAEWGISRSVAKELYEAWLRKDMSASAEEFFDRLIGPVSEKFTKELAEAKFKGKVFLEHDLPLPFDLPYTKGKIDLREPPLAETLARSGFTVPSAPWAESVLFRKIAPFLSFYYDKSDTTLNRWLKRHLSWLGTPNPSQK